jgi:DNA-binding CsgD family transcriptional regulator
MAGMFNLTLIETDVMERLATGESRESIAKSYKVSERTLARTIQLVYVKAGITGSKTDSKATLQAVAKLAAAGDIQVAGVPRTGGPLGCVEECCDDPCDPEGRVKDMDKSIREGLHHGDPGHDCSVCHEERKATQS